MVRSAGPTWITVEVTTFALLERVVGSRSAP
jgi:hypothetical protein